MAFELVTVPCLDDNYAFLLHNDETGQTILADAPEAAPIIAALDARGWGLDELLITHHHHDHVGGVDALRDRFGARVIGAAADRHRLPTLDAEVAPGDVIETCGIEAEVIDVSGHTIGHIAFHLPKAAVAFTGDSLMAMGCGRLFEGSAAEMWPSLQRLRALPAETQICSGHEYTAANARFALTIEPGNAALAKRAEDIDAARARGIYTVPSELALEIATNPFLRADAPGVAEAIGMADAAPVDVFAEVRARKDRF